MSYKKKSIKKFINKSSLCFYLLPNFTQAENINIVSVDFLLFRQ